LLHLFLQPPQHANPESIMSLSTQLTRGTLALPMLALFGVLALVAGQRVEAESSLSLPAIEIEAEAPAVAAAPRLALEARIADAACGAHGRPQLLLANAPGDLGPIAQRQGAGCRPLMSS
jgi:hypothetical protein